MNVIGSNPVGPTRDIFDQTNSVFGNEALLGSKPTMAARGVRYGVVCRIQPLSSPKRPTDAELVLQEIPGDGRPDLRVPQP